MDEEEELTGKKEQLQELLHGPPARLRDFLTEVHPADLAEWMLDLSERSAWQVFEALGLEGRAELLEEAEDQLREDLVDDMTPRQLAEVVEELPADEVADLLSLVDPGVAEQILRSIDFDRAKELRKLATYDPETAGGMMTTEMVVIPLGQRLGDAIKLIKKEGEEVEEGLGLYVVDEDGRPVGYLPDRALLLGSIHDDVVDAMSDAFTIHVEADQEEAANRIGHYGLNELAVVDDAGRLVGKISVDDAQDVLEEEASEDILKLVGASAEALQTRLPILRRVLSRLPLQGVTVAGGIATAWVIDSLLPLADAAGPEPGPAAYAAILAFVPVVIGLAGNVGIQCSTILVRAFATGEVEPDRELSVLSRETAVGVLIGLLCGAVTCLVTTLFKEPEFALSVGIAIATAVTWAAFLGCAVPIACRRSGIDPAISAGPFLITLSDLSGTALYLGTANLLIL